MNAHQRRKRRRDFQRFVEVTVSGIARMLDDPYAELVRDIARLEVARWRAGAGKAINQEWRNHQ